MERVYRTPILTLDPDAKAGGGLVEVVTLADAQAVVESLQGQLKQLDRTLADVYAQRDGLQRELVASKAENSRLMGVAEQQRELRESGEVYLDDVKAQLRQVQRERDELQVQLRLSRFNQANAEAAQNGLQAKIRALTQQLDAEREKVKGLHEITKVICTHCCEPMEIPSKAVLQTQLTQLQALVRALPVAIAVHMDCSIERYVRYCTSEKLNYECAFPSKEYAQAFAKLLEYRATLGENS